MHNESITKFARWFHQDTAIMFSSFDEAAHSYVSALGKSEREALAKQLTALLTDNPGKDGRGLRNAFVRLGAQAAPRPDLVRGWLERTLTRIHAA